MMKHAPTTNENNDNLYRHDPATLPSTQALVVTWLIGALTVLAIYVFIMAPGKQLSPATNNRSYPHNDSLVFDHSNNSSNISVIAWQAPPKDWHVLVAQRLQAYEQECHRLLEDYSRLLEVVEAQSTRVERVLHKRWQDDVEQLAKYAQQQQATLENMLMGQDFVYRLALSCSPFNQQSQQQKQQQRWPFLNTTTTKTTNPKAPHHHPVRIPPTYIPDASYYDTLGQVVAHLVRDWSSEGQPMRQSLYDWCLQHTPATAIRILVPGAGCGRLAWELSMQQQQHRVVHAVELSWTMVAVYCAMVGKSPNSWTIYPYLNDIWTNQVSGDNRFTSVQIPNVPINPTNRLSWTVADFVTLSQLPQEASNYDAIVTCFFLDTATNVLDYLQAMERLLVTGGRWINVGPLHWHANARIVLSAEDLYALLTAGNAWNIMEWSIDTEPLEYRSITTSAAGEPTSTRYEAYRPLRFVVEKR